MATFGTSGNDILNGTSGDDRILGLSGNDQISGGSGNDIIYGDTGDTSPQSLANTGTAGHQSSGITVPLPGGGYYVVWYNGSDTDNTSTFVSGQFFDASGTKVGGQMTLGAVGSGFYNVEGNTVYDMPQLAATITTHGDIVVAWQTNDVSNADGSGSAIVAQGINSFTGQLSSTQIMNTDTFGNQSGPAVIATNDGGFFLAWSDHAHLNDTTAQAVRGQFFTITGAKNGAELTIGTVGVEGADLGHAPPISLASLNNGNIVVNWQGENFQSPDGTATTAVLGSVVNQDTQTAGSQFLVNTPTAGNESVPVTVATQDGGFFTVWYDNANLPDGATMLVHGQFFNANGSKVGAQLNIGTSAVEGNTSYEMPPLAVTVLAGGKIVVTWQTDNTLNVDGSGTAVVSATVDPASHTAGPQVL
ncbi:MAG: hypothetical protein ORN49_05900, partial [Rhodobacteraceae bacterium]|nr:hypothetical protein [Paracoccaceae bacterium]